MSQGIALCVEKGLINSFSVLPFTDAYHDTLLKSLITRFPHIKIGSHLSLIQTAVLSPGSKAASNLPDHPHHYRDFLKRYLLGRYPSERIYSEWKAQIQFLGKYLGGPERLSHLDSHQHIHVLPGIWPVAVALQKEFAIPRLRVPYESLSASIFHKFPFGLGLQALAFYRAWNNGGVKQAGDRRRLIGFFTSTRFNLEANRKRLSKVVEHPEIDFELMVHPALPAEADSLPPEQYQEIQALERLREFFHSHPKNRALA